MNLGDNLVEDLFVCSNCGAFVSFKAELCTYCGSSLINENSPGEQTIEKQKTLTNYIIICTECNDNLNNHKSRCNICDIELDDELNLSQDNNILVDFNDFSKLICIYDDLFNDLSDHKIEEFILSGNFDFYEKFLENYNLNAILDHHIKQKCQTNLFNEVKTRGAEVA